MTQIDPEREKTLDEAAERLANILLDQWESMQRQKNEGSLPSERGKPRLLAR